MNNILKEIEGLLDQIKSNAISAEEGIVIIEKISRKAIPEYIWGTYFTLEHVKESLSEAAQLLFDSLPRKDKVTYLKAVLDSDIPLALQQGVMEGWSYILSNAMDCAGLGNTCFINKTVKVMLKDGRVLIGLIHDLEEESIHITQKDLGHSITLKIDTIETITYIGSVSFDYIKAWSR